MFKMAYFFVEKAYGNNINVPAGILYIHLGFAVTASFLTQTLRLATKISVFLTPTER